MTGIDVDAITEEAANAHYETHWPKLAWSKESSEVRAVCVALLRPTVELVAARVEQDVRQQHVEEILLLMCNNADDELRLALARLARGGSDAN